MQFKDFLKIKKHFSDDYRTTKQDFKEKFTVFCAILQK